MANYLCFTANTAGSTITFPQAFQYSSDGTNWSTASTSTAITLSSAGSKIYVRNGSVGTLEYGVGTFEMTGSIAASGNIMSLVDNTCSSLTIPCDRCFYYMFENCTSLTTAPALPATTLTERCYYNMFRGCTSLTTAPALPATTLTERCYSAMFASCTSLTTAPALPATTLAEYCYNSMFESCTSLTTAPALPATTTLAEYCYRSMFYNCTSLTTVPALPGNIFTYVDCYTAMFSGCTSLIVSDSSGSGYDKAWIIPTSKGTYHHSQLYMFYNCATGSGRSSDDLPEAFISTYYTQNIPRTYIPIETKVTYNGNEIGSISPNGKTSITCNTAGTLATSDIAFALSGVEYYSGDIYYPGLTFTANTAGSTVAMSVTGTPTLGQNFSYSTDGSTWTTFTPGSTTVTLSSAGSKVYFKGNNPNGVNESSSIYYKFVMTGSIAASGNIMSLIDNGACNTLTIPNSYCFLDMFQNCTSLTTAPALPATTLASSCYYAMFFGCTSLTTAPALPATTLANWCYYCMFYGCTSLTTAPALPATTLAEWCYHLMFASCTSLTTAPALPATTLASSCYEAMFQSCPSLTTAPALPATTLADSCYLSMFEGCTSLTTAPALPATTLAEWCYFAMFYDCTSLIVSDTSGTGYNKAWRIPTSGTFSNTYSQGDMFASCATGAGRSSEDMAGVAGNSYTYYTQNTPVS